jgi:cell pole-organizing protein PopZ
MMPAPPKADGKATEADDQPGRVGPPVGGRSPEDTVGELLRPMLKTWLDQNLPQIVERIVREEVQKRGPGSGS